MGLVLLGHSIRILFRSHVLCLGFCDVSPGFGPV